MIIKVKQLSKYMVHNNKVIALNNVNLEINSGEFVSVNWTFWKWKKHTFTYFKWIR